jgi:peptidoglycan-N-acetylglucosamine deacetylase
MNPWMIGVPSAIAVGLAGVTFYGAGFPGAQLFGPAVYRTGAAKKLAITFDDGPNPAVTPKLLELLAKHNAKATFFLVGKFVRECPSLAKEVAARGHALGNHTDTHPNLFSCGPQETRGQLQRCYGSIQNTTGIEPRWFRPPFGVRSPWLGKIVHQLGMQTTTWTQLPGDWRAKPSDWLIERMKPIAAAAQENIPKVAKGATTTTGDILCLHDGDYRHLNGDRIYTVQALEYWLPRWRELGLEFVTMDETFGG